jgi:hypothetical protein
MQDVTSDRATEPAVAEGRATIMAMERDECLITAFPVAAEHA